MKVEQLFDLVQVTSCYFSDWDIWWVHHLEWGFPSQMLIFWHEVWDKIRVIFWICRIKLPKRSLADIWKPELHPQKHLEAIQIDYDGDNEIGMWLFCFQKMTWSSLRYWTGERVSDRVQTVFHIRMFSLWLCDADICVQQKYNFNLDFFHVSSVQDNSFREAQ